MKNNPWLAVLRRLGQGQELYAMAVLTGLVLLIFLTLWLKSNNSAMEEGVLLQQERLGKMRQSAALVATLQRQMPAQEKLDRNQPLLSITDKTIRDSGLEKFLTRIEPDEKSAVHIWFDIIPFDGMLSWLSTLQKEHGVGVSRLTVRRGEKVGMVQARLTLSSAGATPP